MDAILEQVQGKIFSYCDMPTKKMVRCVNHSCALDIDVFTGLSIIIDDRRTESLQFARNVKINQMSIRNLRLFEQNQDDTHWLYNPLEFTNVHHVSILGQIHWKWIEESLVNFSNLTSVLISGSAFDSPIFPYSKRDFLLFPKVRIIEIYSIWAKSNILHPRERRYIFSDSTDDEANNFEDEDEDDDEEDSFINNRRRGHFKFDDVSIEKGRKSNKKYSFSTPVADNIYQLLSIILAPKLVHFRLSYDEDLYNIGYLNWKNIPLREFLQRHSATLEELVLDGDQNDIDCFPVPSSELQLLPVNLKYIFVSIVDVEKTIVTQDRSSSSSRPWSYLKNLIFGHGLVDDSTNLWKRLLVQQRSVESLNCTVYADWGWSILSQTMTICAEFLQVINIGCNWPDVNIPMNMEVIGQCIFLRKLSFNSMTMDVDKRCRIQHLSSLISCPLLESVFITSALCETDDLDVFGHLPSLTCLVLMYVGRMANYGVSVGVLEDFLRIRTLNLLIVVEFYRQKHSLHAHRLKKILKSDINTSNCPIISNMVPYSCNGKFVYVGNIDELSKDNLPESTF